MLMRSILSEWLFLRFLLQISHERIPVLYLEGLQENLDCKTLLFFNILYYF